MHVSRINSLLVLVLSLDLLTVRKVLNITTLTANTKLYETSPTAHQSPAFSAAAAETSVGLCSLTDAG